MTNNNRKFSIKIDTSQSKVRKDQSIGANVKVYDGGKIILNTDITATLDHTNKTVAINSPSEDLLKDKIGEEALKKLKEDLYYEKRLDSLFADK